MSEQKPKTIRLRQIRSGIGCPQKLKLVLRGLGFRKRRRVIERPDTDAIRGMVAKVSHLVVIVE